MMAPDYETLLAQQVLNEGHIVSYRQLSRELSVHSNVAKRMLFHFHQQQKSKKPGSIHAVYLLSGFAAVMRPAPTAQNGSGGDEDSYMQSSPFMSSSMLQKEDCEEPPAVRSIAMCREEELGGIKKTFQSLASIHIYSLGPSTIQNLQILSECNRTAYENHKTEDPLEVGRQYGMIHNARVRRRAAAKHAPSIVTPIANRANDTRKSSTAIKPESQPLMAPKSTYTQPRTSSLREKKQRDQEKQHSTQENLLATQTPGLKREQSEIFSSFAKPRANISQRSTGSPAAASPALQTESIASEEAAQVEEDAVTSEGSGIDSLEELPKSHERGPKPSRTKRSEREEQLRRMMEDDEPMETTASKYDSQSQEPAPTGIFDQQIEEASAVSIATTGGRRRGRRKVMKKKMLKDEEGYLVTKEEPAWESFSEDEPPPKEVAPISAVSSAAKSKKGAGKPGQGNIMSFFGKK